MMWNERLVEQVEYHWQRQVVPRMAALRDDEYFWEPVDHCWSVRPVGDGTYQCDWAFPEPTPPPVTTIAWRLAHLATGVFGFRAANHFGTGPATAWFTDGQPDFGKVAWPGSAADALALVEDTHDAWVQGVRGLGEDGLAEPCGPAEGPFAQEPKATLVPHINREAIHHAAEIATLRGLYRARAAEPRLT